MSNFKSIKIGKDSDSFYYVIVDGNPVATKLTFDETIVIIRQLENGEQDGNEF